MMRVPREATGLQSCETDPGNKRQAVAKSVGLMFQASTWLTRLSIVHLVHSWRLISTIVQPVAGGTRNLRMRASYRSDEALSSLKWSMMSSTFGVAALDHMNQSFSYNASGVVQNRTDAAVPMNSRYYGYDALLRLTCEARGASGVVPTATNCVSGGNYANSLFTYNDGASATTPPDTRASSFIQHNLGGNQ